MCLFAFNSDYSLLLCLPVSALLVPVLLLEKWPLLAIIAILLAIASFRIFLHSMTASFTIGEAMILSNLVSIFFLDAAASTAEVLSSGLPAESNPVHIFMHALILGMLCIGVFGYLSVLRFVDRPRQNLFSGHSLGFHMFSASYVLLVISPWTRMFLDNSDPFQWALSFIFAEGVGSTRTILFIAWLFIVVSAILVASIIFSSPAETAGDLNIRRKYYHLIAVAIFLPGYLFDVSLA